MNPEFEELFPKAIRQQLANSLQESLGSSAKRPHTSHPEVPHSNNAFPLQEGSPSEFYRLAEQLRSWESPTAPTSQAGSKNHLQEKPARGTIKTTLVEDLGPSTGPSCVQLINDHKGGTMADLSGYKDLSRAPLSLGESNREFSQDALITSDNYTTPDTPTMIDADFNGNFQTLIRLINDLPEGVTKQTGAQIIRLTMESMGIFMEDVLSDAQAAQAELLDAVRANIKKIEEYKSIIRKLETDIKYYQSKANELSEIIDLFILSNTSGKVPSLE